MILVIDVGNTQVKAAVFEDDILIEKCIFPQFDSENEIKKILKNFKKISQIAVSNVGKLEKEVFTNINSDIKVTIIDRNFKFPFTNLYASPNTLGIDRMVLAAGAVFKFPKNNRLVIDAGTCITYDYIDEEDNYLGGAISPGILLRYHSLNNYTANLPLLQTEIPESTVGNSTNNAIHSGVINGILFEIDGFISSYIQDNENFIIILTGGDAEFLAKRLKNTIFANSNFLLESLNQTIQYNQK